MLANREGTFHAYPVDVGVNETGPNHLVTVIIVFKLFEERFGAGWLDCSQEAMEITGWFYLEKKDGSLNDKTIESLKAALGWDGRDPFWLQDNAAELAEHAVQVKLAFEEFNGATNLKVQYLNPYGSTAGGVSKADDNGRKSIQRRIGSKLRALAGGTPANPPKPTGKPAARAAKSTPAPAGPPLPAPPSPAEPAARAARWGGPRAVDGPCLPAGHDGGGMGRLRPALPVQGRRQRRGHERAVVPRPGGAVPRQARRPAHAGRLGRHARRGRRQGHPFLTETPNGSRRRQRQ